MLLAAIANGALGDTVTDVMQTGEQPCCSDLLLEIMLRYSQFMRSKNVSHFITHGRQLLFVVRKLIELAACLGRYGQET